MRQNEYREYFNALGEQYLNFSFTKNTYIEVDFLLEVLNVKPGQRILDIGCGTGRHAIELTKRGFHVTGIDFSESLIKVARQLAQKARVCVEFVCEDALNFVKTYTYDAAISICEGAFGFLERDEDNLQILQNIADSMKDGAYFVLTTLNGYYSIRTAPKENTPDNWFDPIHCVLSDYNEHEGRKYQGIERPYIVPELLKMHSNVGLEVLHVYGGTAGNWGRRTLNIDEIETMLISRKSKKDTSLHP